MTETTTKKDRFRWWLWHHIIRHPKVCPAGAHSRIIWREKDRPIGIDWMCRQDREQNGTCWCGKLSGHRG